MNIRITIMLTLLAIGSVFSACGDNLETDEITSSINVSRSVVSLSSSGGMVELSYSIDNAVDGRRIEVMIDDSWIRQGTVTDDTIGLEVEENTGNMDRIATVTLSLKGAEDVYVVVMQGKPAQEYDERFDIAVSNITTSGADIRILPADKSTTWLYGVVLKDDYDSMGAQKYIQERIDQINAMTAFGPSFEDFLAIGDLSDSPASLNDDMEYYVTAFDLTPDAKSSGRVALKRFRTEAAAPSSNVLTVRMAGSLLTVTPTVASDTFLCDVITKELWDTYNTHKAVAQEYVSALKSYNYLVSFMHNGSYSEDFSDSMSKGTQYVAYAFGYRYVDGGAGSGITTDVFYTIFTY